MKARKPSSVRRRCSISWGQWARDALPARCLEASSNAWPIARALFHRAAGWSSATTTAALDHATGEAVMKRSPRTPFIRDRAAVVVTHDSRVFHFADVIAHMDDGRSSKRKEH